MAADTKNNESANSCFAIMPISDHQDYEVGHFAEVYENIIVPAVVSCGYSPIRADQVSATNLIHLDILKRILEAPLAICDLSSANPNVMFELGIRQAFDMPVVLIKDTKTRKIFDIDPIRTIHYDAALRPRTVKATVAALSQALIATRDAPAGHGLNSIVGLLGLQAAALKQSNNDPATARMTLIENALGGIAESVNSLRAEIRTSNAADAVSALSALGEYKANKNLFPLSPLGSLARGADSPLFLGAGSNGSAKGLLGLLLDEQAGQKDTDGTS